MPTQPLLLIVAQSGRFIAQSATRAGYTVRVADCFGDTDTLEAADQWLPLPAIDKLTRQQFHSVLEKLSAGQPCQLICGTGVEAFYPFLTSLPAHISLIGNSVDTMAQLREPEAFFALLDQLTLPYPKSYLHPPAPASSLLKDLHTAGGQINKNTDHTLSAGQYYQRIIDGESFSMTFLADGQQALVFAWNRQINRKGQYLLAKIRQPEMPPPAIRQALTATLDSLVKASELKGFNSLDFIVDQQGRWYLLEINPRISASLELLNQPQWMQWHLDACAGRLPALPSTETDKMRILEYLFAEENQQITQHPAWPRQCHDLPTAGSVIETGLPICTLVVAASTPQAAEQRLQQIKKTALENCLPHA